MLIWIFNVKFLQYKKILGVINQLIRSFFNILNHLTTALLYYFPYWLFYLILKVINTYLSTAIATNVKTDAQTDIPCTRPLSLHIVLLKGQPDEDRNTIRWWIYRLYLNKFCSSSGSLAPSRLLGKLWPWFLWLLGWKLPKLSPNHCCLI